MCMDNCGQKCVMCCKQCDHYDRGQCLCQPCPYTVKKEENTNE